MDIVRSKDDGSRKANVNLTMALFLIITDGYKFLGCESWKQPLKWIAGSFQEIIYFLTSYFLYSSSFFPKDVWNQSQVSQPEN